MESCLLQCVSPLMARSGHIEASSRCPLLGVKRTSFAHGSKRCIALIALGEEPLLDYTIHHACLLVHHCLSVDSGCLRKEGGRISRTAWPNWATWPYRPPRWNGHSFRRWRMSPDLHGCVRGER